MTKLSDCPSQDAVTAIALLHELHNHNNLQQLKMQMDREADDQPSWRLSFFPFCPFCPFCQYSGSNDQSSLNHTMCGHYCMNYGCGKCQDVVFTSGQRLSKHMKKCKGLLMDVAKEKPPSSSMKGVSPLSSNKKKRHNKKSHGDWQPGSQKKSQGNSQTTSQKGSQTSSQMSPHQSIYQAKKELIPPHHNRSTLGAPASTQVIGTQTRPPAQKTMMARRSTKCTSTSNAPPPGGAYVPSYSVFCNFYFSKHAICGALFLIFS